MRANLWCWLSLICLVLAPCAAIAAERENPQRTWTIYLAQDKHLDYNWCGSTTEVELRMVALTDYYLDLVEQSDARWNLDSTIWLEVYRRHRGEQGAARLLKAIRDGRIGCAGNRSVLLWGILSTELAIRACYGAGTLERAVGAPMTTALVMENPGLTAGIASVLAECGIPYLGRGIYDLRSESYNRQRQPYPLFWWLAPSGKRILVRWDLYDKTGSWGGYAEAYELAALAGEKWDVNAVQTVGDRNRPDVFEKRKQFIAATVARYERYGASYPISSILLLGTGWDNWTCTSDLSEFIRRYNRQSDGRVRIVDARYEDFFTAAERELREKSLDIPTVQGTFGIAWEEWAAHLAGPTRDFREAERLLRQAEARLALEWASGKADAAAETALEEGFRALLDFAEHDFGGIDWRTAALSAAVRAGAATRALSIARSLGAESTPEAADRLTNMRPEKAEFDWRGGRVRFDPGCFAITSVTDERGREWVPQQGGLALGEFVHTRYENDKHPAGVFPKSITAVTDQETRLWSCLRGDEGVQIVTEGFRSGFGIRTRWLFHASQPWIDVTYELADGWSAAPQAVRFCFPTNVAGAIYRYDTAGAVLKAGPSSAGGDDLPGANPSLWAAETFASASGAEGGILLLTPDACLVQFGAGLIEKPGMDASQIPAAIVSMPMMNLTRNDRQFEQGGQRRWQFRYRLVLLGPGPHDPLRSVEEAQQFATPPYLQAPGAPSALPALRALDISFPGGPVTAVKRAEDDRRLVVRVWNVLDQAARGSIRLPPGYGSAEACDALERPLEPLKIEDGRAVFEVPARGIGTVAIERARRAPDGSKEP